MTRAGILIRRERKYELIRMFYEGRELRTLHYEADTAGMRSFIHGSPLSHLIGSGPSGRMRIWPSGMIANLILAMTAVPVSASEILLRPYIPTTILTPGSLSGQSTSNSRIAYIFSPNDSGDSVDLLSLDISSTVSSSSASNSASTITAGLPFFSSSSDTTTFTPTLASDGSIIVFAGDCASDSGSSVWIYNTTSSDQPSWKHHQVTSDSATGPQFLGGMIAFSEIISPSVSSPQIYSYGGQCPNSTINGTTWIDSADYTNSMTQVALSIDAYEASTLSLKTQPIAEAGFSLTQLLPSTSNISGIVTQNINSVVLGGHTQNAFVNMSTAAIWALPEASWSFVSISDPSSASSTATNELAKDDQSAVQVQSRSGHTAVLNEDGTQLVILGGWVGNTSQAAEPQLAVLKMNGNEFGDWEWSVPDEQPLNGSNGIFGHGAALLPGNVMMVAGGYAISSSLSKRDDISVAGGQLQMFFNLTSLTWASSYTNPSPTSSDQQSGGTSLSTSTKLGLGLGLGLGIFLVLVILAVVLFCIRRSRRNRHRVRDDHIRDLNPGATFITSEEMFESEHERAYPWGPRGAAQWYGYYTGGHDPYLRGEKYENLRSQHGDQDADLRDSEPSTGYTGSMYRKPVPRIAKGLYQPTGVDESRAMGVISPILEDEEDELSMHGAISPDKDMEGNEDDPFVTPRNSMPERGSYPQPGERRTILLVAPSPSPEPHSPTTEPQTPTTAQPQHPEVQNWVSDVASDALITQQLQPNYTTRNIGRASPTRRQSVRFSEGEMSPGARTESNISESNRSAFSFMPNRSESLRVAPLTVSNPDNRGGTSHSDKSSSSNTDSSYMTAKSIPTLQQEGPTLLLGRPRAISAIENVADDWDNDPHSPGSPSKSKPPRRSWFGSLRRVFSGGHSSGSSNAASSLRTNAESPTHGESSDYDRLGLGTLGLGGVEAGLLLKRKQGRSGWDGAGETGASASGHGHGAGEGWDEEDWDIERAVEQRLVQVMFSVPKERLRIVNGEPDIISIEESVVVVDPESEEDEERDDLPPILEEGRLLQKGKGKAETRQTSAGGDHQLPQIFDDEQQRLVGDDDRETGANEKGKQRQSLDNTGTVEGGNEPEKRPLLLGVPQPVDSEESETPRRSFSPGVPMTAEEVRFEKPRTPPRTRSKVQEMIESLEQRSRSSSPVKEGSASSLRDSLRRA
ncbi:hypothetical protein N0V82_000218 [Gnomoniopsis sp. IMI 355080]|nr:hypothetical protein N0V82_000218 [Gnomoniopsis sp. IMI 355080]